MSSDMDSCICVIVSSNEELDRNLKQDFELYFSLSSYPHLQVCQLRAAFVRACLVMAWMDECGGISGQVSYNWSVTQNDSFVPYPWCDRGHCDP